MSDRVAWIAALAAILTLSLWGRPIQGWVHAHVRGELLAWGIGGVLAALTLAGLWRVVRYRGTRALLHLLWLLPGLALLPEVFPLVEERVHFIVFGLFGFFTLRLFPLVPGLAICALVAGLDELLQAYLPDRVGDLRDVGVNLVASIIGGWLAWKGRP